MVVKGSCACPFYIRVATFKALAGRARLVLHWIGTLPCCYSIHESTARCTRVVTQAFILVDHVERNHSPNVVATAGRFGFLNAGTNIIVGDVQVSVEVGGTDDNEHEKAVKAFTDGSHDIAVKRRLSVPIDIAHHVNVIPMSPLLLKCFNP